MSAVESLKKCRNAAVPFIKYLTARIRSAGVLNNAAALSYTTLLAVVPFTVVILSVFGFFPFFGEARRQLQDIIVQNLMPDTIADVQKYMNIFISSAGKLTAAGLAGTVVTSVLMLSAVENSFDSIFKVRRRRKLRAKILNYAFIITVCPLLAGLVLYLKGMLFTLKYFDQEQIADFNIMLALLLPHLLTFGFLMLCYVTIPNKKTGCINAFCGAAAAFIMLMILRKGFGSFIKFNVTYSTLYGALAAVPALLVWMYLWWTVVLSGAVLAAALGEYRGQKKLWRKKLSAKTRDF